MHISKLPRASQNFQSFPEHSRSQGVLELLGTSQGPKTPPICIVFVVVVQCVCCVRFKKKCSILYYKKSHAFRVKRHRLHEEPMHIPKLPRAPQSLPSFPEHPRASHITGGTQSFREPPKAPRRRQDVFLCCSMCL